MSVLAVLLVSLLPAGGSFVLLASLCVCCLAALLARPAVLLRVVGDVPPASLEMKRGRRLQLSDSAAALGTRLERASENFWMTSKRWPHASHWYS